MQDWKWSNVDVAGTAPQASLDLTAKAIQGGRMVLGGSSLCPQEDIQIYNIASQEKKFEWVEIPKLPYFWELQLLDTPFRKISDVAHMKEEGELPPRRIGSAVGTSMGRVYIFSGKVVDDEDVSEHMASIIVLSIEPDNSISSMIVEKPDGDIIWPESRTGGFNALALLILKSGIDLFLVAANAQNLKCTFFLCMQELCLKSLKLVFFFSTEGSAMMESR